MADEYLVVKTAVPDREVARAIAKQVLDKRLAASVQIVGPIESHYWWRGELCRREEYLCLSTTKQSRYTELEAAIVDLHPYVTPEVTARPIVEGHGAFLEWIDRTAESEAGAPDGVRGSKAK